MTKRWIFATNGNLLERLSYDQGAIHIGDAVCYNEVTMKNKSNPYSKNAAGFRKWQWLNERKAKAEYVGQSPQQDPCGSYQVYKYRGRLYCGRCGARLAKENRR